MIKKYINSLISLKYSVVMTTLSFIIFILSYITVDKGKEQLKPVVLVFAILLAIVLVLYYSKKIPVNSYLRKVKDMNEYDTAVMLGTTFVLENRMLVYYKNKIKESYFDDLTSIKVEKGNPFVLHLLFKDETFDYCTVCASENQVARFAKFLQVRNPSLEMNGVKVMGDGSLKHIESGLNA